MKDKNTLDAYLDIETTGLSCQYCDITVIGIYLVAGNKTRFMQLVGRDANANNLLEAVDKVGTIYTYNGSRFDLPFIHGSLGVDLKSIAEHHDLMYDCWRCNLKGGFKAVEEQLGIPRKLKGIDGWQAVLLWRKYLEYDDRDALNLLLQYNKEDVINLKKLKEKLGRQEVYNNERMSAIDEVKQKIDIVELVSQYTTLKKAGRNLTALCPFHSEKTPSFFVYPDQQSWHCFGACSTGGDAFSFLMKKEGVDFGEALRQLAQRAGVVLPSRPVQDTRRDEKDKIYQLNAAAAQYFHQLLLNSPAAEKARKYITGRGLNQKVTEDFQLGYAMNSWDSLKQHLAGKGYTENEMVEAGLLVRNEENRTYDRFRDKLLFAISEARGRITGFGARVLDDSLPKYVNSPQTPVFDKSSTLYGINLASSVIRQKNMAVIVEGYMDVIAAHQYGESNVVASMGTSITDVQVTALKKLSRNIVLVLDPDAAGEEAMLRRIQYEDKFDIEMKFVILPGGKDPDDIIKESVETWHKLTTEAMPVVDYTVNIDRNEAVNKLIPIIAGMTDDLRRDRYIRQLERLTGIRYDQLESSVKAFRIRTSLKRPRTEAMARATKPLVSSPLEESCLALLLQHPELKDQQVELLPDYFENSANREIFVVWQQAVDVAALREQLDPVLQDSFDGLINKDKAILATRVEERYNDYVLRLREENLRSVERKRAAVFALEAELKGAGADRKKLEEDGIEASVKLGEIFAQRAKKGRGASRNS